MNVKQTLNKVDLPLLRLKLIYWYEKKLKRMFLINTSDRKKFNKITIHLR
jgi:hypothetical protein